MKKKKQFERKTILFLATTTAKKWIKKIIGFHVYGHKTGRDEADSEFWHAAISFLWS